MSEPSALALASMPEVVGLAEQPVVLARCSSTDKQVSRGGTDFPLLASVEALGAERWATCVGTCVCVCRRAVRWCRAPARE
jgi:hypothetical protein